MCGLSGYYSISDQSENLDKSILSIAHRGPDASGVKCWSLDDQCFVGLGHVRLSIIDLSNAGSQPMTSSDGKLVMVFNGEIYNHTELRNRLSDCIFVGHSDSEVLLEYYRRFGAAGFSDLRGMFAIAIFELETRRLIIARDQIGVKPLYYKKSKDGVFFSSEIRGVKSFLSEALSIDSDSLFEFLSCGFVYEPNTGFVGVKKIPAGSYAVIENGDIKFHKFFDIDRESRGSKYSDKLIEQAVKNQLDSDAKLGVFYSGGLDSSVIAALAQRPCLFLRYAQKDFEQSGATNDEPYAVSIAKHLKLDVRFASMSIDHSDVESVLESMRTVAAGTEELISDYTFYAAAELSQVARAEGFKVMLSGMGGDEVFVGYPRYRLLLGGRLIKVLGNISQWNWLRSILRRVPLIAKKIDRFSQYYLEKEFAISYARLLGYFSQQELRDLLGDAEYEKHAIRFVEKSEIMLKGFSEDLPIIKAIILDYHGFLSHNLTVADKSSMSAGVELRVPFLDQDLYCGYLGALRSGAESIVFGKRPLKKKLLSLLPSALVNRRKTGFNPPLDTKINLIGETRILQILRSGAIASVLNLSAVEVIVHRHFSNVENNSYKIWQLLYFQFWLDEHSIA